MTKYTYPGDHYARQVQHIEPDASAGPWRYPAPKRRRYVDAGWLLGLGIVACVSSMVALVMLLGNMW